MLMTVPIHFPYTTLFRSLLELKTARARHVETQGHRHEQGQGGQREAEGDPLGRFDVGGRGTGGRSSAYGGGGTAGRRGLGTMGLGRSRSEEHTSELQSRFDLVCRPLLEK